MIATYMLLCADGTYYVGSTRNLEHRLIQHASGTEESYTSKRLPIKLVWYQEAEHIGLAHELEKKLQGWGRAKREALIRGEFDRLPALSRKWDE